MPLLVWDSSGLAKRYTQEPGSDTVLALFASVSAAEMATSIWSYAETFSVLLRCLNRGAISAGAFSLATSALESETIRDPNVTLRPIEESDIITGIGLMRVHNLNSIDAAFLAAILHFGTTPLPSSPCVLVAADQRLLRAARAEGLAVLNPEQIPAADVPAFLAAL